MSSISAISTTQCRRDVGGQQQVQLDVVNISYLNPNDSYLAAADVKLPRGLFGSYQLIVKADNANAVFEENENNNALSKAVTLQVPPLPDLRTTLVQAPEEAFTGQPMLLNWRVENRGTGNTPPDQMAWADGIYLSQDQTLNTATDRFIGSRPHTGALVKDDGYTVNSFSLILPPNIAGNWFVFVVTDYQNAVYEFTNENNNSNYDNRRPTLIRATPPDLIVQTAAAPATGTAARQVTVNWTVKNQGAFDANPAWTDTVYLSSDATLNPANDTALASVTRGSLLGPGLSYNASAQVTLPACLTGTYYLFVYADSGKQLFEFDPTVDAEQNNFSQPLAVQIIAIPPDLQVSSVTHPPAGNAGQTASITWTVNNPGAGPTVEQNWIDRIYFSPTPAFDGATALNVGSFVHNGGLAQNASYSRTENIAIPTTAQGPYYVFVIADASDSVEECANENNNSRGSATVITVTNNLPDLRITAINAPATGQAGQTLTVTWTGQNAGVIAAPGSGWNDAVYLSDNQTLDSNDRQLAAKIISGPLAVNATYQAQAQFTLPVVTAGTYYLIVKADDGNFVFEGMREDNNANAQAIQISVPPVDLLVTAVDAPAQAFAGQQMLVGWMASNAGTAPTFVSQWTDAVILSRDQVLDSTDPVVGYLVHNGALANGGSYSAMLNVEIPPGLTGIHFVFVRTDRNNVVAETDENNNTRFDTSPANLQLPPPVDLTVASINAPAAGSPGEEATIQWTVNNTGNNIANGQWTDAVYLSSDQTWDINDMLVGRYEKSGPVPNGQSYSGSLAAPLPPVTPGSYYVIVRTDVRNRVFENNEGNNTTASIGRIAIDVPELTLGVARNSDIRTGQERYYKVNVPSNETLLFTLDGQNPQTSNELYTRFNFLPSLSIFDFLFSKPYQPDQETLVPNTQAGNYFSLVRGAYVPPGSSPDPFSIKAEIVPFGIRAVSPSRGGNIGQVTLRIDGAKFDEFTQVTLSNSGQTLNPIWSERTSQSLLYATFDLRGAQSGLYNVRILSQQQIWDVNRTTGEIVEVNQVLGDFSLPGAFEVIAGGGPSQNARLLLPSSARRGNRFGFTLEVRNEGLNDLSVPVLLVTSPNNTPLSSEPQFSTRANSQMQVVVQGSGRRDILMPGEKVFVQLYGLALREPSSKLILQDLTAQSTPVTWGLLEGYYRDRSSNAEWNQTWSKFRQIVGNTWGELHAAMRLAALHRGQGSKASYYTGSELILDLLALARSGQLSFGNLRLTGPYLVGLTQKHR